jgi:Mor family transcriptional regulator
MQRIVKELAEKIGIGDALEVVRRWGGRELYVPVKVEAADPLALTLGLESARKLVAAYGGQRLQLPSERNALLDMRNEAILRELKAGRSHESTGLMFGLSRQAVANMWREHLKEFAGSEAGEASAECRNS